MQTVREFFFFLNNFLQNDLSHSIQYRSANPLVERVYDLKPVLLDRRVSRDSSLLCNLVMQTIQLSLFFSLVMERNDRVSLCGSDGRMKKKRPRNGYWIEDWIKRGRVDVIISILFTIITKTFEWFLIGGRNSVKNQR